MKTPINPWSVAVYILAPAIALGFLAAAVPALFNNAHLAKTLGWSGCALGAFLGLAVGLARRFR